MQSLLNQTYSISYVEHFSWEEVFVLKMQGENQEDSWLNNYQRGQIMDDFYGKYDQVQAGIQCPKEIQARENKEQPETPSVQNHKGQKKSLFHNFQKNLICLLKRAINIKRKELVALPFGVGAYNLWKWFRDESLYCKKSLYITFGVKAKENQDLLKEVASLNPEVQKMLNHYGIESFQKCQGLLRETVHRLASQLKDNVLKRITKVKDFPSFYNYFLIFVEQLSQGALSQRMNKIKTQHMRSFQTS